MENPHRSQHTVGKIQNKDFIKKSDAYAENPISGLNVSGEADCKVADGDTDGENVDFEEYYVDVEDTKIIEEEKHCEEDEDKLFYCNKWIKDVKCASKVPCAFDSGEEGGLYTSQSNQEFMNASGGMTWSYNGDILSFGADKDYLYGALGDAGGEACHSRSFTAKFFIKDKVNVSEFKIIRIYENNLLNISINGQLIRNGFAMGKNDCWHNAGKTDWENWNFDLKPYLKEGWNTMSIDLRYTKGGHAAIKIRAKQYCCKDWDEEWDSDCPV